MMTSFEQIRKGNGCTGPEADDPGARVPMEMDFSALSGAWRPAVSPVFVGARAAIPP